MRRLHRESGCRRFCFKLIPMIQFTSIDVRVASESRRSLNEPPRAAASGFPVAQGFSLGLTLPKCPQTYMRS